MKIDPPDLEYRYAFNLISSIMLPRPTVLVSTIGENGVLNTAPYALITCVSIKPLLVGFSAVHKRNGQKKDTQTNIEFSKDFVVSVVNESLAEPMNQASADYPPDVSEFKEAGLTPMNADIVKSPMVAESPINIECRLVKMLDFGDDRVTTFIIGEIVRVHIKDELYVNNDVEPLKLKAIGRLGADYYCRTTDLFEMEGPKREY